MDWTNDMELRQTGCIFRYRGVLCPHKDRCENCGWNPKVEVERKLKIREERKNGMGSA